MDCSKKMAREHWAGKKYEATWRALNLFKESHGVLDDKPDFEKKLTAFLPEIYSLHTMTYPDFFKSSLPFDVVNLCNQLSMGRVLYLLHLMDRVLFNVSRELITYADKHTDSPEMKTFSHRIHAFQLKKSQISAQLAGRH